MEPASSLAIGCFASLCRDRLAGPLVAFGAVHPEIAVGVHEMGDGELLAAVKAGRLALAVRPGGSEPGLSGCDLWMERAVVAMPVGHPLAAVGELEAAMLAREVLLVSRDRARAQLHRFLTERLFATGAPATRIVADARRSQVLARVAAGEGIALLCASQVDAGMAGLEVRMLADAGARFPIGAYWLKGDCAPTLATLVGLLAGSREG